jgi:hypothetical protein
VVDNLKAVARGDKRRLDPDAVEAAKKIMERQGMNNPGMADNSWPAEACAFSRIPSILPFGRFLAFRGRALP